MGVMWVVGGDKGNGFGRVNSSWWGKWEDEMRFLLRRERRWLD